MGWRLSVFANGISDARYCVLVLLGAVAHLFLKLFRKHDWRVFLPEADPLLYCTAGGDALPFGMGLSH